MPVPRELFTTDVFDTVITRALGEPRQVGYLVATRLRGEGLIDVDAEVFVETRERAEHLARRRLGPGRTLADVVRELAGLLGLPAADADRLLAVELDVELSLTRELPGAGALLAAERGRGAQVGFLSDTPMTAEQVRTLLARCGVVEQGDLVWTSSDLAAEKGEGEAYAAVAAALGGRPRAWRHRGDNRRSDALMARLSGVEGTWAPAGRLTRDEQRLDRAAPATGGTSSALAGASRRARLLLAADGDEDPRTPSATGVLAPLLVGYALWAVQRCRTRGVPGLRVTGPAERTLREVLAPLVAALAPQVAVLAGADAPLAGEVVLHSPGATSGPGLHLVRVSGEADEESAGWLRDDVARTGSVEADVDAALLVAALAAGQHPGPALVAREVAGVLPLLPWETDLRGAALGVARRLALEPTAAEARRWAGEALAPWPAADVVLAGPGRRAALVVRRQAQTAVGTLRHKGSRGIVLVRGRLTAHRP
ncbi:hypothetical protein [Pseudokineococcus sp. 1T1Z-3]|uniref:hypothetical protein n=1 Tax=Pseudokineococcus sp. 1T1Z-3 TaxID=3132745 RepID=UPI0030A2BDA3